MWRVTKIGSPEVLNVIESSPDSAETNFRELDDVFLQTQTRVWLGEVLGARFDKDVRITDLLADGELLFQVSKVVWKMLLKENSELKHSNAHIYERTSFAKSDGRYMPYSKVDSFLKICKILGLTGVDLFSPTDVIEKYDIRRVCMCIRSLSKKSRSKNLNVPDFDIVTCTVVMPTCLVSHIRRNIELTLLSPTRSSSVDSPWLRELCELKIPFGKNCQHFYSGSDESESSSSDFESVSPLSSSSYDASSITGMLGENKSETSSYDASSISGILGEIKSETSSNNSIEGGNHYEVIDEHHEEMLAESACSCTTETCAFHVFPSSSYSNDRTGQDIAVSSYSRSKKQESSAFENAISFNYKAMDNDFYCMGTSDDSSSVALESYSMDPQAEVNNEEFFSGIKSLSVLSSLCTNGCRQGGKAASYEIIKVEKQENTIMLDKCRMNKCREGRASGKTGNQILKSVAGVLTMVGALVLFRHLRQKDTENINETGIPSQLKNLSQERSTKRKMRLGKSDALYSFEKLKF